jgi:hypothetical protein
VADGTRFQFIQVDGKRGWRSCHRSRQLINRCTEAPGVATGMQTSVDVELKSAIGEYRDFVYLIWPLLRV